MAASIRTFLARQASGLFTGIALVLTLLFMGTVMVALS